MPRSHHAVRGHRHPRAGRARRAAAGLVLLALLTACTAGPDDGAPSSGPPSTSAGAGSPAGETSAEAGVAVVPRTAAEVRAAGEPLGVGGLTGALGAPEATPSTAADGTRTLTWRYATGAPAGTRFEPLLVAAPEGAAVEVRDDGSALVRDAAGAPVAAAPPPTATGARARWRDEAADLLRLVVEVHDPEEAVDVAATLGDHALVAATWGDREGGRSLAVEPAPWVRRGGEAPVELLLAELVATEPEAGSATMRDQLVCHALGAPDKETWNLEPWRPDVGLLGVVAAACNPT